MVAACEIITPAFDRGSFIGGCIVMVVEIEKLSFPVKLQPHGCRPASDRVHLGEGIKIDNGLTSVAEAIDGFVMAFIIGVR